MTVLETDKRGRPKANMPKPTRRPMNQRTRRQFLGAIGLLAVLAIIGGVILTYEQVFTPGVTATVLSPRAGLLMEKGADVTLDGVTVGQVTSIDPVGDSQARLGIKIQPNQQQFIPSNVTASIDAPSVFGPKFVNLTAPKQAATQTIQAGQVINQVQVSPEIDTVFSNLVGVLNSVHPAKVAATLGAISTSLNGQGANLGNFIGQFNSYLQQFNPSLPALGNDLAVAPSVANAWSIATPDALKTLDNLRVTSGTLTAQQAQFDAFLVNLSGFAGNSQSFLSNNEAGLTKTLSTLLPTSQLLNQYSPEIGCLTASASEINNVTTSNSLTLNTAVVPGAKEYSNPSNLPVVGAKSAASCYGGPLTKQTAASWNGINFNDGSGGAGASSNSSSATLNPNLAQDLFGSNAAAASSAAKKGK
jgi:phospholipid/cholesterol/gamma-HCH transport system substrate-binding protein